MAGRSRVVDTGCGGRSCMSERLHATAVALPDGLAGWRGVLLRGPSGAGKSDLALRLIEAGARLVADDQVELSAAGPALVARAPGSIAGRMEVRGLGIVDQPMLDAVQITLVCDLVPSQAVPRLPDPVFAIIDGVQVPAICLSAFEASTPAKVRLAVGRVANGIMPASR